MANDSKPSFFQNIIDSILNKTTPEAIKRKRLKQISKNLSKARFKFYKSSSDQALPALAKFFFEIYKALYSANGILNAQKPPAYYKMMVIDYSLTEEQRKTLEELSEEQIMSMSANMKFEQLKGEVKEKIKTLNDGIDKKKAAEIEKLYAKFMAFRQICTFDYYFMLKKFDPSLKEGEVSRIPKFNQIDVSYIIDDLMNFTSVAWAAPLSEDWDEMMKMLRQVMGVEPVKPQLWQKIAARLEQMRRSQVFEMIIQLATQNPDYFTKVEIKTESIVTEYVEKVKTQAQLAIQRIEAEQKNSKIDSIVTQIFGTSQIFSTKFYTEENSKIYEKKGAATGFEYARHLNYAKAFLIEYFKKEVRTYVDLVLVRGKWADAGLARQMSDAYNTILENSDKITEFDKKLAEDGDFGVKLKMLMPRLERDREARNIMSTTIRDCNAIARELCVKTTKMLVTFGKCARGLIDDHKKQHPELLTNWKELERFSETPIDKMASKIYKQIYLFVNLMQQMLAN